MQCGTGSSPDSDSTSDSANAGSSTETEQTPTGIKKLNVMLDPRRGNERAIKVQEAIEKYEKGFGNLDMTKAYENLFEILWYSQLPCFDVANITSSTRDEMSMLKRCFWKGKQVNCTSIFKTRPTDRGMCCSFNMNAAEEVFRKSNYGDMINRMQRQDLNLSFESEKLPEWYVKANEPMSQAGLTKGLMLVLDAHTDRVSSGSVSDNFRGFVSVIEDRNQYPLTSRTSTLVRPGQYNLVAMSALSVDAEDDIKGIDPKKRNCYFPDENPLEIHKVYSQANCILECSIKYARKEVAKMGTNFTNCTPWFYPEVDQNLNDICNPWETRSFQDLISSVPSEVCSRCLPDCKNTIYEASVSAAPFRPCDHTNLGTSPLCDLESSDFNPSIWTELVQTEYKDQTGQVPDYVASSKTRMSNNRYYVTDPNKRGNLAFQAHNELHPTYDAYSQDIAMVNFYFEKSSILQFKRAPRLTMIDYISQMGGLLGLGIGFSLVSAVEILYWLTIRLFRNVAESNKKTSKRFQRKKAVVTPMPTPVETPSSAQSWVDSS